MLSVWSHRVGAVQPCAFSKSRTIAKLLCTSLSEPYLPGGWTENLGGWTENPVGGPNMRFPGRTERRTEKRTEKRTQNGPVFFQVKTISKLFSVQ